MKFTEFWSHGTEFSIYVSKLALCYYYSYVIVLSFWTLKCYEAHIQCWGAENYLRYKCLDTHFRYFKSILYLETFSDMYLVSVSKIQIKSILYHFIHSQILNTFMYFFYHHRLFSTTGPIEVPRRNCLNDCTFAKVAATKT